MKYRYMIWNDVMKCFQFPSICTESEKDAYNKLFKLIGNDARKWRFIAKKITADDSFRIRQELNSNRKKNKKL